MIIFAVDVDVEKPDEKSIMTYVAQFLKHHPDHQKTESGRQQEEVPNNLTNCSFNICFMV